MPLVLRNKDEVLTQLTSELRKAGITFLSKPSVSRAVAESVASEVEAFYKFFDTNYRNSFLNTAVGDAIDNLGFLFNVRRIQPKKAYVSSANKTVLFYVETGTFGDINSAADITIPVGTLLFSNQDASNSSIQYQVSESAFLDKDASLAYVSVQAILEGTTSNVGSNILVNHDFSGYTQASIETLKVTNKFALISGVDKENDQKLRFRVASAATALQKANLLSLQLALLSVPGVVDLKILRYFDGIGTTGVFITGQDNETPPSLLVACQVALNQVVSAGEIVTVYEPTKFGIQLTTQVNLNVAWTINVENEITVKLLDASFAFFSAQSIGTPFSISDLRAYLVSVDSRIQSIGKSSTTKYFDELYVWKTTDVDGTRVRSEVIYPYPVLTDPLGNTFSGLDARQETIFIAESSIDTPFVFEYVRS